MVQFTFINSRRYNERTHITDDNDMTTRTEELRELMKAHKLTPIMVGEMLERQPQTVRIWLCKSEDRNIPKHSLDLLRMKLAQQ